MKSLFYLLLTTFLFVQPSTKSLFAQEQEPNPCGNIGYSQFDFWIGDWEVFARSSGELVGTNSIKKILGGCVLEENWAGVGGSVGKSFNTYDPGSDKWTQTWVDNSGSRFVFTGSLVSGNMLLEGKYLRNGKESLFKLSFFPDPSDGSVRQLWEQSVDGGSTWIVIFDGIYRKKS